MVDTVLQTDVPGFPRRQGKVRDLYDLGDRLVLIATDRISAFDWILPNGIPGKGQLLTAMTLFWLDFLQVPNHLISADIADLPSEFHSHEDALQGRTMLVRKTSVIPIECVVRGYLLGSGWKDYQRSGSVCGVPLPIGLQQAQQLPEAIFTPATKADSGHDENITWQDMTAQIGTELAEDLRTRSVDIYRRAADHARPRGIILADTKFEWGHAPDGELLLIDEVLSPDSSRFWPASEYQIGISPPSFDKQFVRDWLETSTWDKNSPPPELPNDVVEQTREKYEEAYRLLTS